MTSKGLGLVLVAAMVVSACGGTARRDGRAIQPGPMVVDVHATSAEGALTPASEVKPIPSPVSKPAPAAVVGAESSPSATSTTVTTVIPSSTTTSPAESVDLAEVRNALDALDALFGGLDGHIGSIELDEGETP